MIKIINGKNTIDGGGVKIFRVFSNETAQLTDPFLLLDYFGSDNPNDYKNGFPWHPHRGIETVTYMIRGDVEHQDYMGNKGVISAGDIQWMSAGSGIIHQEMPQGLNGMYGVQLWVNMPRSKKMMPPKYRGVSGKNIKIVQKNGITTKVISGEYESVKGVVTDLIIDVVYLDVQFDKNKLFTYKPKKDYTTVCFIVSGSGKFMTEELSQNQCVLFRDLNEISIISNDNLRFLLISGKPLREPIAWGGPIVMNTETELQQAFQELNEGTFIKSASNKADVSM